MAIEPVEHPLLARVASVTSSLTRLRLLSRDSSDTPLWCVSDSHPDTLKESQLSVKSLDGDGAGE